MKDCYLSISKDVVNEIIIEKSRFITTLKKVNNEDEAKEFLTSVRSKYSDATHNCYAYIADNSGFYIKFSDDGEPQGTAGLPMLETLKAKNLKCVLAVVTRYFGGIKLGTGGLARAYSDSVKKAILVAGISNHVLSDTVKISVSYSLYSSILNLIETEKLVKNSEEFLNDGVEVTFTMPTTKTEAIRRKTLDLTCGKSDIEIIKTDYFEYDENDN